MWDRKLRHFMGSFLFIEAGLGPCYPRLPPNEFIFCLKVHRSLEPLTDSPWRPGARSRPWELQALVLMGLCRGLGLPSSERRPRAADVSGPLNHSPAFFVARSVSQGHEEWKGRRFALLVKEMLKKQNEAQNHQESVVPRPRGLQAENILT